MDILANLYPYKQFYQQWNPKSRWVIISSIMKKKNHPKRILSETLHTFTTKSVTETDKYLAMLATTIHFPLPAVRGLWILAFDVLLVEGLTTTSRSHINTCSFGSLETPSLTKDWRKLSLISPTDTDSTAPCQYQSQNIMNVIIPKRLRDTNPLTKQTHHIST